MHPGNEFDDDPPTVVSGFRYEKLPVFRSKITLDPYERFRLAAAIFAARHWTHLLIAGEVFAFIVAVIIATRFMTT